VTALAVELWGTMVAALVVVGLVVATLVVVALHRGDS
jgi:hypothetical protein